MKTLVALGDSWTYGSELEDRNQAWPYGLAKLIGCDQVLNLGKPATSIYHLLLQVAEFEKTGISDPVFIIGITDEARYMFWDSQENDWHNLTGVNELAEKPGMSRFIKEFVTVADTMPYRKFYLGLVLSWLQNYFKTHNYQYVMFKQFNSVPELWCDGMLDRTRLYRNGVSILADLTKLPEKDFDPDGEPYDWDLAMLNNPYFTNKIAHPCEQGHKFIAELLYKFYNSCYT